MHPMDKTRIRNEDSTEERRVGRIEHDGWSDAIVDGECQDPNNSKSNHKSMSILNIKCVGKDHAKQRCQCTDHGYHQETECHM